MPHHEFLSRTALVSGGGIGGAAVALLLARSGIATTVVARVPEPADVGAALLIQPNGLAVLQGLGLGERLRSKAAVSRATLPLLNDRGRILVDGNVPVFGPGLDVIMVVRRSHLLALLHDALAEQPGATIHLGTEVIAATQGGTLTSRQDAGQTLELAADLVVAADGTSSVTRDTAGVTAELNRSGVSYVRTLLSQPPPPGLVGEFWTSLGLLGVAPVDGGTYLYASCAAPVLAQAVRERDAAGFAAAWMKALPAAAPVLEGMSTWGGVLVNEVVEVHCSRFCAGRLVVLGDAAHAMAPNLGQGANSALVDAAVLVSELRKPGSVSAALERYDQRRRPTVARVQRQASQLMRVAHVRQPAARLVRDAALTAVTRLAGQRATRSVQQEDPGWLLETTRALASG